MALRHVTTTVHGRFLHEPRDPARLLAGFHGYAQTAEIHLADLQSIPGSEEWSLAAVQALHPFYTRGETAIVASWMTSQDRDFHIADNLEYVRRVLSTLPPPKTLVFLGFSQGAAMAFRAAADFGPRAAGLIVLGGDVPLDVAQEGVHLPPVLLARGERDDWYKEAKFKQDLNFLRRVTDVTPCVFDGAHEWTDEFRAAAGEFLRARVTA